MANADVTCDYCGRTFGNAGAKANHEQACDQNPANQQQQPQGQRQAAPPARQQGQQPREAVPATQGEAGGAGEALGELIFAVTSDDASPRTKGQAAAQGLGLAGQIIQTYQDLRHRNERRKDEIARNVELEPAVEYADCPECGYQFGPDDVGTGDGQVRCPGCDGLYNIRVEERDSSVQA